LPSGQVDKPAEQENDSYKNEAARGYPGSRNLREKVPKLLGQGLAGRRQEVFQASEEEALCRFQWELTSQQT